MTAGHDDDDTPRPARAGEAGRRMAPPLGADASILEDEPDAFEGLGEVLSAPVEVFGAGLDEAPLDEGPLDERASSTMRALHRRAISETPLSVPPPPLQRVIEPSFTPEPASAVDTVDLESPDLDDDDPAEPSSLVGEIPWHEEGISLRVAFAGGKGGAGRTLLAANVALFIARLGRSVVLADLDPAGANLHGFLGLDPMIPPPGEGVRPSSGARIERVRGMPLRLVRASRPIMHGPEDPLRAEVLATANELAADVLILDLGTQADPLTLDAFLGANVPVAVVLPERSAMERTYAFLRAALDRRLLQGDDRPAVLARALLTADDRGQIASPNDLVSALMGIEPQAAEAIRVRLLSFAPALVVNRCRTRAERDLTADMCLGLKRRWGINPLNLSGIDNDDAVNDAVRRQRPLVLEYPGATVVGHVERLARQVLARAGGREVRV